MDSIKVIGESCFIFSDKRYKIITDPWFGESIYGGSWTQFPMPYINSSDLTNISHIFISHVHADHCCLSSIKKIFTFSPNSKIILLNRKESCCYLSRKIISYFGDEIKKRILIHDPYKQYNLGNFRTWCLPPEETNELNNLIDSSLLIENQEGLILFSNDNLPTTPHAKFINSLKKDCLLALIPFSGGSGYPSSYSDIPEDEKLIIAEKIRNDYLSLSIEFLKKTNFKYFMPIAGNHIIVGKSLNWHKTTSFLYNPYKVLKKAEIESVNSKGVYFYPGENINFKSPLKKINTDLAEKEFEFRKSLFIESISSRINIDAVIKKRVIPKDDWIYNYFEKLGNKFKNILGEIQNKNFFGKYDHLLIINTDNFALKINQEGFIILKNCGQNFFETFDLSKEKCWLLIKIDITILFEIYKRKIHINEADAGGLLNYKRNGTYNPVLYTRLFEIF